MKPLRLTLSNFQSHRLTELDCSSIQCAVLSGPNGAGKSSIIDAIRFALFGYARGGNLDTVVMEGEQVCRVEFEFALGDSRYLVSRQRSSKKGNGSTILAFHRIEADGSVTVLDGKTAPETQARISAILHMTDDLFTQTACANQGNAAAFSRAKPADRKTVLSEILDLSAWEARAKAARAMGDKLQAARDVQSTSLTAAEAKAATVPQLESDLAEVAANIESLQALASTADGVLTDRATERESLLTAKATDEAARASLVELTGRQDEATAAVQGARTRLEAATTAAGGREAVAQALAQAEQAGNEAAELEAKRQARNKLLADGNALQEQIKTARAEHATSVATISSSVESAKSTHAASVRALETQIKQAVQAHGSAVYALEIEIGAKRSQTDVLSTVPCTPPDSGGEGFAKTCPLLGQALDARDALPALETQIEDLRGQTPWADDEVKLAELRTLTTWAEDEKRLLLLQAQTPAADLVAQRDDLKRQCDAIEYDAAAWGKAQQLAAKASEHQRALDRIDAAAEQIPDAKDALEKAQSELSALETRVAALTEQLGPWRNWTAELAAVDKQITDAKAEQSRLRTEIATAQQRQGALSEQLRQAQEAAEQVEALRTEIAEIDRRVNLLKILGNPRDGAFSKGGIPALLIERAVPELEAAANEVLETLSDGRMFLSLRTQKENSSKGVSETLDIAVMDERGERLYESFSGGECMRVDLALRVGLSTLMAQRAGARCDLLVLDEACAPLDVRGREQFVECVSKVADRFGTVLVITHIPELRDAFPCQIAVTKNGEGSQVEVMYQ